MSIESNAFGYIEGREYPYTYHNDSGVLIQVIQIVLDESDQDFFSSIISVLMSTTRALDMLNVDSIRCGQNDANWSPAIDLTMLNVQGADLCFLS